MTEGGGYGLGNRVLICHTDFDRDLVNQIEIELAQKGLSAFRVDYAQTGDFADALRIADAVLFIVTRHMKNSPTMMAEFGMAVGYAPPNGLPLLLPCVFDDVPLPIDMKSILVRYIERDKLSELAEHVLRSLAIQRGSELARSTATAETVRKIEKSAPAYVEEAIAAQRSIEASNQKLAKTWQVVGFGSLVLGIIFVLVSLAYADEGSWIKLMHVLIANFVVIGFLGACARYAFSLGRSYASEALKASDRIHAISFGKFYLEAFSAQASWSELKEVFAHWNIDRSSNFTSSDIAQIDPQILTTIGQLASLIGTNKGK